MLYSCTHMATVGVKGLKEVRICWGDTQADQPASREENWSVIVKRCETQHLVPGDCWSDEEEQTSRTRHETLLINHRLMSLTHLVSSCSSSQHTNH